MKTLEEIVIETFGTRCVMNDIFIMSEEWECDDCPLKPICKKLNEIGV